MQRSGVGEAALELKKAIVRRYTNAAAASSTTYCRTRDAG